MGIGRSWKEYTKNRLKKKIGLNYKDVPINKLGGLKTREEMIDKGVDFMTRQSTAFGSWTGFTWYGGYKQDLLMQKNAKYRRWES